MKWYLNTFGKIYWKETKLKCFSSISLNWFELHSISFNSNASSCGVWPITFWISWAELNSELTPTLLFTSDSLWLWLFLTLSYKPFSVFLYTVMALLYIVDFCYNLNKRHKGSWDAFHWVELWLCEYTWDGHGQTKCLPFLLGGATDSKQPFDWSLCLAVRTTANFNNKKYDYMPSMSIVWNVNN